MYGDQTTREDRMGAKSSSVVRIVVAVIGLSLGFAVGYYLGL